MQSIRKRAGEIWSNHRAATLVAVAALIAILVAAGYLAFKRPGDVSNEDAFFEQADIEAVAVDERVDWPTYGLTDERTRYLPADLEPPFRVAWRFKGRSLLEYAPILFNGTLYVVNKNGELFAINAARGKKRFTVQVGELSAASPTFGEERIVASTLEPGNVTAIDKLGKVHWQRDLPGRTESSPVVADSKVIVGCECGTLYAFDVLTGKTVWETDLGGPIKAAPAVDKGVAYVGDYGGALSAVNIDDGSIKWQTGTLGGSFGRTGRIYATAAVAFGRVYVGSLDGRMYSFEQETGKLAWSKSTGGYIYAAAVAADTDKTGPAIYFGSYDGTFYALDAQDGSVRWQKDTGGDISGAASLIGETVYVAELQTTRTFGYSAKDGDQVFEFRDGTYNPVISDGKLLYLAGKEALYALSPGEPKAPGQGSGKGAGGKKKGKTKGNKGG